MMAIRKASPHEAHILVDFQFRMAFETEDIQLDVEKTEQAVRAVFSDEHKGIYFVALHNEQIVGSLLITYEWSDWRNGTVWWIQSVYVVPEARGQGVYRSLYAHIKTLVEQEEDLKGIRLYVDRNNGRAQEVYKKLGMDGDHYQVFEWMK